MSDNRRGGQGTPQAPEPGCRSHLGTRHGAWLGLLSHASPPERKADAGRAQPPRAALPGDVRPGSGRRPCDQDELGSTATVHEADEQEPNTQPGETGHDGEMVHHDDAGDELPARLGIGRSIRPGTAVPSTVLVSNMGSGALCLSGWQQGPGAYLTPEDATPLRRELARAFGSGDRAVQDDE